jgi:hypothetical protein
MKYLILMTSLEGAWEALSESEQQGVMAQHDAFQRKLESEGRFVATYHVQDEARTVRRSATGEITTTSEPFSGRRECVGGLYVIEADSIEEATRWAQESRFIPGANEVRPLYD